MNGRAIALVIIVLLLLSLEVSALTYECGGCITQDCSSQTGCCPDGDDTCLNNERSAGGCGAITKDAVKTLGWFCSGNAIVCNSTNLEKASNDSSFGSDGFVYGIDKPYYCTNYNLTGDYVWKTCYSGAPDSLWVSTHIACDA